MHHREMEVARQVSWPGPVPQQQDQVTALALSYWFLLEELLSFGCLLYSHQQIKEPLVTIHSLISVSSARTPSMHHFACIITSYENLWYQEPLSQKGPSKIPSQMHAFWFGLQPCLRLYTLPKDLELERGRVTPSLLPLPLTSSSPSIGQTLRFYSFIQHAHVHTHTHNASSPIASYF